MIVRLPILLTFLTVAQTFLSVPPIRAAYNLPSVVARTIPVVTPHGVYGTDKNVCATARKNTQLSAAYSILTAAACRIPVVTPSGVYGTDKNVYATMRKDDVLPVNSLLWKIDGNGLKAPSYLFGTIHLICENDVVMSKATKRVFSQTKQLAMEIDMGNIEGGDMFGLLEKGALMKGDTTLEMLLDTASMEFVRAYFQDSLGVPLFPPMNRMKPMFLGTMLLEGEQECEQTSYEEEFVSLAKKQKKPTLGIETVEEQLALFDYLPYKQQAEMLVGDLKSMMNPSTEASGLSLQSVTKLYKEGKISDLLELLRAQEAGEFEEVLLNRRNRAWIPILERMIRSKSTFIAVGAGHLAGEQGVINLLRKQGFRLTPVR